MAVMAFMKSSLALRPRSAPSPLPPRSAPSPLPPRSAPSPLPPRVPAAATAITCSNRQLALPCTSRRIEESRGMPFPSSCKVAAKSVLGNTGRGGGGTRRQKLQLQQWHGGRLGPEIKAAADSGETSRPAASAAAELAKGSAVVVVVEPPFVKTAEPMPMMKANEGIIKVGDAGRILDRKPKDVWAVRFSFGAYLLDRKYFEPLEQ